MKARILLVAAIALAGSGYAALAQGNATGPGAVTGDPAASSASAKDKPGGNSGMSPNSSGSGTSTSGGRDANGDQGRDKMPDSSIGVRPLDKQNKPEK